MNCSVAAKLEKNLKVNTTTHHSSKLMRLNWMIGLFWPTLSVKVTANFILYVLIEHMVYIRNVYLL